MNTLSPAKGKDNKALLCVILGTVADIRLMIAHNNANMETFQHDFQLQTEVDVQISETVQEDLPGFGKNCIYLFAPYSERSYADVNRGAAVKLQESWNVYFMWIFFGHVFKPHWRKAAFAGFE